MQWNKPPGTARLCSAAVSPRKPSVPSVPIPTCLVASRITGCSKERSCFVQLSVNAHITLAVSVSALKDKRHSAGVAARESPGVGGAGRMSLMLHVGIPHEHGRVDALWLRWQVVLEGLTTSLFPHCKPDPKAIAYDGSVGSGMRRARWLQLAFLLCNADSLLPSWSMSQPRSHPALQTFLLFDCLAACTGFHMLPHRLRKIAVAVKSSTQIQRLLWGGCLVKAETVGNRFPHLSELYLTAECVEFCTVHGFLSHRFAKTMCASRVWPTILACWGYYLEDVRRITYSREVRVHLHDTTRQPIHEYK